MATNAQKTHFALELNDFAQGKVLTAIKQLGRALPCHVVSIAGQIVTVAFDVDASPFTLPQIAMPIATSVYDWLPIQVGDRGTTKPNDTYIQPASGIGSGTPDLTQPGNLSALVFVPCANASWKPPQGDQNMRVVQGPDGVTLKPVGVSNSFITVTPTAITMIFKGHSLIIDDNGITLDGVEWLPHTHSDVSSGPDDTGPVVP